MQVKDILQKTTQFFRNKGIETARLDSELLISAVLNWERMKLYLNYEYPLTEDEVSACREFVRRRSQGEPVAYILGKRDFYNHTFFVNSSVLIPRPETEHIVEEATKWIKTSELQAPRLIDFGTGSGCLGLSLLAESSESKLVAVDISKGAIEVAAKNAESLSLSDRVHFIEHDVAELQVDQVSPLLGGLADVIVANPPYIAENDPQVEANVKKFEPATALFSPEQGLQHIKLWAAKAAELLRGGGFIMFEIGHEQGRAARDIFEATGSFTGVQIVKDLSGRERFVRALRSEEN